MSMEGAYDMSRNMNFIVGLASRSSNTCGAELAPASLCWSLHLDSHLVKPRAGGNSGTFFEAYFSVRSHVMHRESSGAHEWTDKFPIAPIDHPAVVTYHDSLCHVTYIGGLKHASRRVFAFMLLICVEHIVM